MKRGDVYLVDLDPAEGSEQAGTRPVIIMSRDAINLHSPVVIGVPCTTFSGHKIYASQIVIHPPEGGLTVPTVALGEQVAALSKSRFKHRWGAITAGTMANLERALAVALDLELA